VTITSGATEGLYGLTQALLDPGDGERLLRVRALAEALLTAGR
jgi:aspartate/methionine/tyrosine aminotransferase